MLAKIAVACTVAFLTADLSAASFLRLQLGQANSDHPSSKQNYFNKLRSENFNDGSSPKGYAAAIRYGIESGYSGALFLPQIFFGLGHRKLSLERSYPTGKLRLDRTVSFYQLGLSMRTNQLLRPFSLSLEISANYPINGKTELSSNTGKQVYEDDFRWPHFDGVPEVISLGISAQYQINPIWAVGLALQSGERLVDTILVQLDYLWVQSDDKG